MYSSLELAMGPSASVAFAGVSSQEPLLWDTLSSINAAPSQLEDLTPWPDSAASMEADLTSVHTGSDNATLPQEEYRSEFVGNELSLFYPEHPELRNPKAWGMPSESDPEQSPIRGITPSTSVDSSELSSPQEERTMLPEAEPAANESEKKVEGRRPDSSESLQYAPVPQKMDYLTSVVMEQGSSSSPQFVRREAAVKAEFSLDAYLTRLKEEKRDERFHVRGMSKSSKRKRQQQDEDEDDYDDATKSLKKRRVSSLSGSKRARPPADGYDDRQVGAAQETHRPNKRVRNSSPRKDKASGTRCPTCLQWLSRVGDLKRHTDSKHKGKKYQCNACREFFSRADALARHRRKTCRA